MKFLVCLALLPGLSVLLSESLVMAQSQTATPPSVAQPREETGAQINPSPPSTPSDSNGNLDKVGQVLLVFLVLSVVFEVALTPIFNWRYFLLHFEGKGLKTPITVILAFLVFWGYGLDIIKDLLNSLGYPANRTFGGQLLTALLIAGGSDGVLRIFTKLGIRNPVERKEKAEKARQAEEENKKKE